MLFRSLYRIDPRPYEVALARAEANLAVVDFDVRALNDAVHVADARIATSKADVAKAQADVVRRAVAEDWSPDRLEAALAEHAAKRSSIDPW